MIWWLSAALCLAQEAAGGAGAVAGGESRSTSTSRSKSTSKSTSTTEVGGGQAQPGGEWKQALPGWVYEFPRDHGPHPEFKTEWWYTTGNLATADGQRFGYQLTLFRQGLRPPGVPAGGRSRFLVDAFVFGHMAVSDPKRGRFYFSQKLSRGAFGEAGFSAGPRLGWVEDWSVELVGADGLRLRGRSEEASLDLELELSKPWVAHGRDGISPKAEGDGHASHYYSGTRMRTRGVVRVEGREEAVEGESWFDHEWASNQLAPGQVGWNWLSLQLSDGSELMLYQMRRADGSVDPGSNGTLVAPDGSSRFLKLEAFDMQPRRYWTSPRNGARYPVGWKVRLPEWDLELEVSTPLENQELAIPPVSYWEGMVEARGRRAGKPLEGRGYLELTGYAGALVGLSEPGAGAKSERVR